MTLPAGRPTRTVGWGVSRSLWMLWGFCSLGMLWFIGFIVMAIRVRSRSAIISAACVTVVNLIVLAGIVANTEEPEGTDPPAWLLTVFSIFMIATPVLAFLLNPLWLRILWSRQFPHAVAHPSGAYMPGVGMTQGYLGGTIATDEGTRWGQGSYPASRPAPQAWRYPEQRPVAPGQGGQAGPGGAAQPGVIDGPTLNVNQASWQELGLLPGVGEQLGRAIVAERDRGGPYERVTDLVTRGVVPPHVLFFFSTRLVAGPPLPGARPAPGPLPGPPPGRRLEF